MLMEAPNWDDISSKIFNFDRIFRATVGGGDGGVVVDSLSRYPMIEGSNAWK